MFFFDSNYEFHENFLQFTILEKFAKKWFFVICDILIRFILLSKLFLRSGWAGFARI